MYDSMYTGYVVLVSIVIYVMLGHCVAWEISQRLWGRNFPWTHYLSILVCWPILALVALAALAVFILWAPVIMAKDVVPAMITRIKLVRNRSEGL